MHRPYRSAARAFPPANTVRGSKGRRNFAPDSPFAQLAGHVVVSYPCQYFGRRPHTTMTDDIQRFITRWQASGAAERANYQLFLSELCDMLNTPRPGPTTSDEASNAYVFEKSVPLPHGAAGRIDLYRRGCFVLEAKQGAGDRRESTQAEALSQ